MKYNLRKKQGMSAVQDYLATILKYRDERGWSEYALAEKSGIPQSTISSWYTKDAEPKISSLLKVCNVYGITLSQLFAEGNDPVVLTESQKELLERWSRLTDEQQEIVFKLIDKM